MKLKFNDLKLEQQIRITEFHRDRLEEDIFLFWGEETVNQLEFTRLVKKDNQDSEYEISEDGKKIVFWKKNSG